MSWELMHICSEHRCIVVASYLLINTAVNNTNFKGEIHTWAQQLNTAGKGHSKKGMHWYLEIRW